MEHCKLQIGCMLVILYIIFCYIKECRHFRRKHKFSIFDSLLALGCACLLFDGLTAYTVNHLEEVSPLLNRMLHLGFLISIDALIFGLFIYMLSMTEGLPRSKKHKVLLYSPFIINVILVIVYIPQLGYCRGEISNYSMGYSAYMCFVMAGIYILLSLGTFIKRWNYIESHKRISILTYLITLGCITGWQMTQPQALVSSIATTVIIVGIYVNQENPSILELEHYHSEMVMGFATLVENKDGSTGGHIKRTTMYVKLLAEELRTRKQYSNILTKDYVKNLLMAAPMHDIGKISVPDVILQKPGKLTPEEFDIMKTHASQGGKIVQETFANLGNEQYSQMAYQVAKYHHEKWNGKGYPEGLKGTEIPLCARIMAIADVFDAVSEKRCYRDAMPLEQCFEIIEKGKGEDFDPLIVDVFMSIRAKVEDSHASFSDTGENIE